MAKKKKEPEAAPVAAVVADADGEETAEALTAVGEVSPAPEVMGDSDGGKAQGPKTEAPPMVNTGIDDHVLVKHGGQEHGAICVGFAMGMIARLKDGKDTEVFVKHGDWRPKE